MQQTVNATGALSQTELGELTALPQMV